MKGHLDPRKLAIGGTLTDRLRLSFIKRVVKALDYHDSFFEELELNGMVHAQESEFFRIFDPTPLAFTL